MTKKDANILIILGSITSGGAQKQAVQLYYELLKQGYTCSLALMDPPKSYRDSFNKENNFKIIDPIFLKHHFPYIDPYFKLIYFRKNLVRVIIDIVLLIQNNRNKHKVFKQLLIENYNIIVPFSPPSCRLAISFAQITQNTHVFFNHRGGSKIIANSHVVKAAHSLENRFHLLSNAHFSMHLLRDHFNISNGMVLKNFVVDRPINVTRTKTLLLHIANYFPEKDYKTLLFALEKLKKKGVVFEAHIYCRFYKRSHFKTFIKALTDLCIEKEVLLFSSGENPQDSLNVATVGVLATKSEGCSNALIEYLQFGLPIITTNIPANKELLVKEYHEYLVEVEDVDSLADSIQTIVEDSVLQSHLIELSEKSLNHLKKNNNIKEFEQYINMIPL